MGRRPTAPISGATAPIGESAAASTQVAHAREGLVVAIGELLWDLLPAGPARSVCVTRGADGARVLLDGLVVEGRPPAVNVSDAVGAGDAFTAGLLAGILEGHDPVTVLRQALA